MITVIATITILIACTIGAIVGFGGGVIIKPVLDAMWTWGSDYKAKNG